MISFEVTGRQLKECHAIAGFINGVHGCSCRVDNGCISSVKCVNHSADGAVQNFLGAALKANRLIGDTK